MQRLLLSKVCIGLLCLDIGMLCLDIGTLHHLLQETYSDCIFNQ